MPDLSQATWRKASRSGQQNQCVEVALNVPDMAAVRDSKLGNDSPILSLAPAQFTSLLNAIKDGRLDR